jgi:Calcineurin-like phosphoesterase
VNSRELVLWVAMALMTGCTQPVIKVEHVTSASAPKADGPAATLFILADNQERFLYGEPTFYSEIAAQKASSVAIRSTEQDLFSKFTTQAAFDQIETKLSPRVSGQQAAPVLHLGDLLDYSCAAEFEALRKLPWLANDRLTVAPGNHDGLFQGNGTYGGKLGWLWLYGKKVFNPAIDPSLDGHHDAVCSIPPPVSQVTEPCTDLNVEKVQMTAGAASAAEKLHLDRGGKQTDCRRDHVDAREQPHHIRCELLELTYKSNLPVELKNYCDDMQVRRYFKGAAPKLKDEVSASTEAYGRHAAFVGGMSPMEWDAGYLVQRLEVPLVARDGSAKGETVLVVLLDTQGWSTKPSGKALFGDDATVGMIGVGQRAAVESWLMTLDRSSGSRIAAVIFAGHYPLEELTVDSVRWISGLQRQHERVLPLYMSAHTHSGYLARASIDTGDLWEINVGSLIDSPVHFRDLRLARFPDGNGWEVRSKAFFLEEELKCLGGAPDRETAFNHGFKHATAFKSDSEALFWKALRPRPQYCTRLAAAGETLLEAGQPVPKINADLCAADDHGAAHVGAFMAGASAAVERLTDEVVQESTAAGPVQPTNVAARLSCAALGGSEAFNFNPKKSPPPREIFLRWRREADRWALVE